MELKRKAQWSVNLWLIDYWLRSQSLELHHVAVVVTSVLLSLVIFMASFSYTVHSPHAESPGTLLSCAGVLGSLDYSNTPNRDQHASACRPRKITTVLGESGETFSHEPSPSRSSSRRRYPRLWCLWCQRVELRIRSFFMLLFLGAAAALFSFMVS
jgi:hypothetical protein